MSQTLRITDKRVLDSFSGSDPDIGALWELCVHLEWDRAKAIEGISAWLGEPGGQRILDCACGSGFPGIDLAARGYEVTCSDGSEAMIGHFQRNAALTGSLVEPVHARWQELPDRFGTASFDVILLRGCSLLYAGTWDENAEPDRAAMTDAVEKIVTCLRPGGRFYVDTALAANLARLEPQHTRRPVMEIGSDIVEQDETIYTDPHRRIRTWHSRLTVNGREYNFERRSHHVTHDELVQLLEQAGLADVQEEHVPGESYTVFTGRRPVSLRGTGRRQHPAIGRARAAFPSVSGAAFPWRFSCVRDPPLARCGLRSTVCGSRSRGDVGDLGALLGHLLEGLRVLVQ
jgi:SAM-dependent methyltransferase